VNKKKMNKVIKKVLMALIQEQVQMLPEEDFLQEEQLK